MEGVLESGGAALASPEVGRSLLRGRSCGSHAKSGCRAAGKRSESGSRDASIPGRRVPALLPRPRRSPAGRRRSGKGAQSGSPGAGPAAPRWAPRPAPPPPPPVSTTCSERSGLWRPQRLAANFAPSGAGAILAKFVRPSPLPTCAGDAPARAAPAPGPRGAARSPGRTGESPQSPPPAPLGGRAEPPPPRKGGGVSEPRGGGGRGDLAYLRWRPATTGRP